MRSTEESTTKKYPLIEEIDCGQEENDYKSTSQIDVLENIFSKPKNVSTNFEQLMIVEHLESDSESDANITFGDHQPLYNEQYNTLETNAKLIQETDTVVYNQLSVPTTEQSLISELHFVNVDIKQETNASQMLLEKPPNEDSGQRTSEDGDAQHCLPINVEAAAIQLNENKVLISDEHNDRTYEQVKSSLAQMEILYELSDQTLKLKESYQGRNNNKESSEDTNDKDKISSTTKTTLLQGENQIAKEFSTSIFSGEGRLTEIGRGGVLSRIKSKIELSDWRNLLRCEPESDETTTDSEGSETSTRSINEESSTTDCNIYHFDTEKNITESEGELNTIQILGSQMNSGFQGSQCYLFVPAPTFQLDLDTDNNCCLHEETMNITETLQLTCNSILNTIEAIDTNIIESQSTTINSEETIINRSLELQIASTHGSRRDQN